MVRVAIAVFTGVASLAWAAAQSSSGSESAAPAAPTALKWKQCEGLEAGFECAVLSVPLCHDASCESKATTGITVSRYETATGNDAPSVWVLSDHKEIEGLEAQEQWKTIAKQINANVYSVSSRWQALPRAEEDIRHECFELIENFETRNSVDSAYLTAVQGCQSWLVETYGSAAVYSTDNAAKDLHVALTTIQQQVIKTKASKTFLYAARSSTRIVQRLIALDIKDTVYSIAGYIYENPQLMTLPSNFDKLQGDVAVKFMASCALDALCSSKFKSIGTSMESILKTTYEAIDKSPEASLSKCALRLKSVYNSNRDVMPSDGARRMFAWMLGDAKTTAQVIAPMLYRLHRCNDNDQSRLDYIFDQIAGKQSRHLAWMDLPSTKDIFIERVVLFSELWPTPTPSQTELSKSLSSTLASHGLLQAQFPSYCVYTGSTTDNCAAVYKNTADLSKSAKITYTSTSKTEIVGTKADLLILATRLGLGGSADAAEQLYKAYTGAGGGQTSVLVVSDSLDGSEFTGDTAATSQGVFNLFVTGKAKQLTGKWYTSDLRSLDSTPSQSTYETAPVSVNFTMGEDKSKWFRKGYDPWEATKSSGYESGSGSMFIDIIDDSNECVMCGFGLGVLWWILIVVVVVLLGACVFAFVLIRHQRRSSRRRFEREREERQRREQQQQADHHAMQMAAADPAYGFQQHATPAASGYPGYQQPVFGQPGYAQPPYQQQQQYGQPLPNTMAPADPRFVM